MVYADRKRPPQTHRLRRWVIGLLSVSLVVWSGVWFVQRLRANSQIAHVKELQQQLADATDTQRRELWGQMRQAMEELPESARRGLWQERRAEFEQRMDDRMKKVLLLPPDQ